MDKDDKLQIILDELRSFRSDVSPRIIAVEKWQANADGKITILGWLCTAIGAGVGLVITGIVDFFKHN